MATQRRKATFSLPERILADLDEAVRTGGAVSKNALVERALVNELRELRRQAERALLEEALRDPLFLRDLEEVEADFQGADAESARRINSIRMRWSFHRWRRGSRWIR